MPHVIVKLYPGRTEDEKKELTNRIVQAVMETVNAREESVSVSIEEIPSGKWEKDVYRRDILGKENALYKKPGYSY